MKNVLVGAECDAMQIYPAESRLVNSANQYHLIVLPEDTSLPFGFNGRFTREESVTSASGSHQRWRG